MATIQPPCILLRPCDIRRTLGRASDVAICVTTVDAFDYIDERSRYHVSRSNNPTVDGGTYFAGEVYFDIRRFAALAKIYAVALPAKICKLLSCNNLAAVDEGSPGVGILRLNPAADDDSSFSYAVIESKTAGDIAEAALRLIDTFDYSPEFVAWMPADHARNILASVYNTHRPSSMIQKWSTVRAHARNDAVMIATVRRLVGTGPSRPRKKRAKTSDDNQRRVRSRATIDIYDSDDNIPTFDVDSDDLRDEDDIPLADLVKNQANTEQLLRDSIKMIGELQAALRRKK